MKLKKRKLLIRKKSFSFFYSVLLKGETVLKWENMVSTLGQANVGF